MPVSLDLISCLNKSTAPTTTSHHCIVSSVPLNTVGLPGLAPQHHDGDTGGDTGQQCIQYPTLTQVLCCRVDQTAATPGGHTA